MNPRNTRVLVFATALLTAPLLPVVVAAAGPPSAAAEEGAAEGRGDRQGATPRSSRGIPQAAAGQPARIRARRPRHRRRQATPQDQMRAEPPRASRRRLPRPPAGMHGAQSERRQGAFRPEQMGLSFAAPQGWQQGDATKFTVPGNICCVWSPDNISSIAVFAQNSGKPYNPRTLLEQSATGCRRAWAPR